MRGFSVLLMLVGAIAAGLAIHGVAAAEDSEMSKLRGRAEEYWQAQETENWAKAYDILSPEGLSGMSKQAFVESKQVHQKLRYSAVTVNDIQIVGDYGWVDLSYRYLPKGFEGLTPKDGRSWDLWRKENGVWRPLPPPQSLEVPQHPPKMRAQDDELRLAKRIEQFWAAREAGDWAALYQLLEPDYRARQSAQEFLTMRAKYLYLSHRLVWTEVEKGSDKGRSRVSYTYKYNDPNVSKMAPEESVVNEEWVKVNDEWFRRMAVPPVASEQRTGDHRQEDTKHENR